ncbi:MAG: DUF3987 domain-containing protein [Lewinellaceae bacterium]|nr:DUF3987 domain-containing protein [Lewinellaceae bacterium]
MNYKNNTFPQGTVTLDELSQNIGRLTNDKPGEIDQKRNKPKTSFPNVLPPSLHLFIEEADVTLGIPQEYLSASILFAASAAIGKSYLLEIKRGSIHAGNIFLILKGNPNSNKSGALELSLQPIQAKDKQTYKEFQLAMASYNEKEDGQKPVWPKTLISDITPEAMASKHLDNPRGLGIFRDEISGWFKSFNRYSKGAEQELFLQVWSGKPLDIIRKMGPPIYIPCPFISVAGTIQPSVIEEVTKENRATNGFFDRLLFTWPDGLEKPLWQDKEMPAGLLNQYADGINRLLTLTFDKEGKPNYMRPEREAKARLFQFFNEQNKPLCDNSDNELLQGLHGKFDLHTLRLALLLQMLWFAFEDSPLDKLQLSTTERAIKLAEYFRAQSLKVFDRLHNASPIEKLPTDRRRVYEALPDEFQTGEGVKIAQKRGMSERAFKRFLNSSVFERIARGKWEKRYE